jgi:hypothetical protein
MSHPAPNQLNTCCRHTLRSASLVPSEPAHTPSRAQRLESLEADIRRGLEEFYHTGMKLKEIRDDELYREAGFDTFEAYCKGRFDWSKGRASQLIKASEYRAELPEFTNGKQGQGDYQWSERSVRELTRIGDKRVAALVAAAVIKEVQESKEAAAKDPGVKPLKLTAALVREYVDVALGINRTAEAPGIEELRNALTGALADLEACLETLDGPGVPAVAALLGRKQFERSVRGLGEAKAKLGILLDRWESQLDGTWLSQHIEEARDGVPSAFAGESGV